jgi:hypothetical protein
MQMDGDLDNDTDAACELFLAPFVGSKARTSDRATDALGAWTATQTNLFLCLAAEQDRVKGKSRRWDGACFWLQHGDNGRAVLVRTGFRKVAVPEVAA